MTKKHNTQCYTIHTQYITASVTCYMSIFPNHFQLLVQSCDYMQLCTHTELLWPTMAAVFSDEQMNKSSVIWKLNVQLCQESGTQQPRPPKLTDFAAFRPTTLRPVLGREPIWPQWFPVVALCRGDNAANLASFSSLWEKKKKFNRKSTNIHILDHKTNTFFFFF